MLHSNQYKKAFIDKPSGKILADEYAGRVRHALATLELSAEVSDGDQALLAKLPTNSRLVDARVVSADWGSTGAFKIGWLANGVDDGDDDGIFGATTATSAVDEMMDGTAAGFEKKFGAETDIVLEATADSTALTGEKIQVLLFFCID